MTLQLLAHAGHGTTHSGPIHYVVEPVHALPILAVVGCVAAVAIALWRYNLSRQADVAAKVELPGK
jgi:hypothetical protein